MSIKSCYFDNLDEAIRFIESFAETKEDKDFLFRGHSNAEYRLCTTMHRFCSIPYEDWSSDIDFMLESFISGLAKLGINPIDSESRLDWMEYARHHGVPMPCIDFSYSPYVALFFAFNGIRKQYPKPETPKYSVVYVLDVGQMGEIWARFATKLSKENSGSVFHRFRYPEGELFQSGFPAGVLQLIPFPGKYNNRMQRQFGALLYDTLNYRHLGFMDIEEFIEKQEEPQEALPDGTTKTGSPILTKLYIDQQYVSDVFTKLELMGMTGGTLYMDPNGVALDVINSYNYNHKTQYLRGIKFPKIDESKLHK
ncbi:MAG: FRG domain-containing protein [Syntrophales bacterium]